MNGPLPVLAKVQPAAFFLDTEGGPRFCLLHAAQMSPPLGLVLYVHPFAEEMNKSRRMAAMQARALCAAGYTVLQMDLLGCGDSAGDFGDATWEAWIQDVVRGCAWLRAQSDAPLWLWGLRAGCMLVAEAAARLDMPCNLLFWAPSPSGKPLLQQFLRLKAASDMLGGQAKAVMDGLRQQLATGTPVEVAGYTIAAALANGLEQATLRPSSQVERVEWLEVSPRADAALSPVASKTQALWQQAGISLHSHLVTGPAFWQTSEIEEAPHLLDATLAAITRQIAVQASQAPVAA